ncbi:MAG: bifunctional diaminohydroxyphosphoribosylaminopyrimidine deaminase/5-amino-6-(5-phosphoribosylamino)uracil reductase RibD [Phycisphaerae bacterium]
MPEWTQPDREFMQQAFDLASKGRGYVEPNPMVGCLIVRRGRIVGRGFHRRFGGPHAEVNALRQAGVNAGGATAYVSLEPCSHVGKTPPCADALIHAGVRRVVVAMRDPNPLVAGRGIRKLRAAGIRVETGLLRAEAAALNAPFITFHREHRPYVILKWAQSIDGKIATRGGDSKWISSRASRAKGHALRARVDAILIGIGTVIADDPDLTARLARPRRIATRVVLDPNLRISRRAHLVQTARKTPTLIVTASLKKGTRTGGDQKRRSLECAGCEVITIPLRRRGFDLGRLLEVLHTRGMTNVMVEGGGHTIGAFIRENLSDEAHIFVAPRLIGGETAPGPLRFPGPALMQDLIGMRVISTVPCGSDLWYTVGFRR